MLRLLARLVLLVVMAPLASGMVVLLRQGCLHLLMRIWCWSRVRV
jgi:hypothetical protein